MEASLHFPSVTETHCKNMIIYLCCFKLGPSSPKKKNHLLCTYIAFSRQINSVITGRKLNPNLNSASEFLLIRPLSDLSGFTGQNGEYCHSPAPMLFLPNTTADNWLHCSSSETFLLNLHWATKYILKTRSTCDLLFVPFKKMPVLPENCTIAII